MLPKASILTRFLTQSAKMVGRPITFVLALILVIIWLILGPFFDFSNSWLLIVNTIGTLTTFLMVFIIQNTQNREIKALHLKIDELIRSTKQAENALMAIEEMNEEDLEKIKIYYDNLGHTLREKSKLEDIVKEPSPETLEDPQHNGH